MKPDQYNNLSICFKMPSKKHKLKGYNFQQYLRNFNIENPFNDFADKFILIHRLQVAFKNKINNFVKQSC